MKIGKLYVVLVLNCGYMPHGVDSGGIIGLVV